MKIYGNYHIIKAKIEENELSLKQLFVFLGIFVLICTVIIYFIW